MRYGEGAANVELGGHESGLNLPYDPKAGTFDLSQLAWSEELSPGLLRKQMLVETRAIKGAFFFDMNGDGRFSRGDDFPMKCFVGDARGGGVKARYSLRSVAEAEKRGLIRGKSPALEAARGWEMAGRPGPRGRGTNSRGRLQPALPG